MDLIVRRALSAVVIVIGVILLAVLIHNHQTILALMLSPGIPAVVNLIYKKVPT